MLSLQRQGFREAEHSEDSLPPGSLGEVFDSIEDLRRVVQEITLEEIREAEEKALLMVRRLSSLQTVCANFAAIRQFVIKVQQARLHVLEEDSGKPGKEIPQPWNADPSSGNAPWIKAEIDAPFHQTAAGALPLVTSTQPAAPNPAWEAGVNLTAASHGDLPEAQRVDFTLGDNQLGEQRFELGVSLTHSGAETKKSIPAQDHYAALTPTPEATSPPTFSFHQDQESTVSSAIPEVDQELMPPGFFDQMINNFTAFVGPMAALIVEEQVTSLGETLIAFPRSRLEELIALVSREILDEQAKVRFEKQMAKEVQTLAFQTPRASQRKKND